MAVISNLGISRLYYEDSYLRSFDARIIDKSDDGTRVYLDRTAFYPSSGGQPFDLGTIAGVEVTDVVEEGERVAHVVRDAVDQDEVNCHLDWIRRFDHMQQHSGQHILSAVFDELFGLETLSFHLGLDVSTIDLKTDSLESTTLEAAEQRANEIIFENRLVSIAFEDAATATGLRKPSERTGTLRIISIEGLDRSACGGTHVRATGEVGSILIRATERIRGNVRLTFLCGARAVRRTRADFNALATIARRFSAPLDDTPSLVAAQADRLQESEKARRKLAVEVACTRGEQLYAAAQPNGSGVRIAITTVRNGASDEELRAEAKGFTAQSKAAYVAVQAGSVMVAVSADSGVHAGNIVKAVVTHLGGKGGGAAQLAQGSIPPGISPDEVSKAIAEYFK